MSHIPVRLRLGSENDDAIITLGSYSTAPVVSDFPRDGEWYSFDIPVAELKKYGQLWSKAQEGILPAGEYLLCLNTMDTYYSGSYFSFDNVFLWNRKDGSAPEVSELGRYTTKSLDNDGRSYFDFSGKDYCIVNVGDKEREAITAEGDDRLVQDYSINEQNTHLYLWEGTYVSGTKSGTVPNSFGNSGEGWIDLVVADKGWTGAGIINDEGYDLSAIDSEPGEWYLHFATRGEDSSDLNLILGKAHFTIGAKAFVDNGETYPVLGNFRRDGEWYSYDIPMTEFYAISTDLFPQDKGGVRAFKDNFLVLKNGGHQGDELQIDNIFFWREHKEADGIRSIQADTPYSRQADGIYDLSGRQVCSNRLQKGIYIIRGKKVVVEGRRP